MIDPFDIKLTDCQCVIVVCGFGLKIRPFFFRFFFFNSIFLSVVIEIREKNNNKNHTIHTNTYTYEYKQNNHWMLQVACNGTIRMTSIQIRQIHLEIRKIPEKKKNFFLKTKQNR